MKKYITILFTVTILLLTCACGQINVNMDNVQINHTADMPDIIKPIEELDIIREEVRSILPEEERRIYEAYLAAYEDEEHLYTYFDYDNDGKLELYYFHGLNTSLLAVFRRKKLGVTRVDLPILYNGRLEYIFMKKSIIIIRYNNEKHYEYNIIDITL